LEQVLQGNLPGKEYVARYLTHLHRLNRRANTLRTNVAGISLFLRFLQTDDTLHRLLGIQKEDVEAFVEHEQDRGAKPATVCGRLNTIYAFLRFLVELGVTDERVLRRKVRIRLPEYLPRAMDPDDVKRLLGILDGIRDRAMVLMLLRSGMRIGELLDLESSDVDLDERKAMIYEAGKTGVGRVVYFTDDARDALTSWFKKRDLKSVTYS
jgi:integrase/recombinase XerD